MSSGEHATSRFGQRLPSAASRGLSSAVFSRRSTQHTTKNRITLALERNPPRFDLTESNPTRDGSLPYPHAALLGAFDAAAIGCYEPDPHGLLTARRAVAELQSRRGTNVSAEQVTLASGTSEAYGYLFKLLCDPGDDV